MEMNSMETPYIAESVKVLLEEKGVQELARVLEDFSRLTFAEAELVEALMKDRHECGIYDSPFAEELEEAIDIIKSSEHYENMTLEELARQTIENRPEEYEEWKGMAGKLAMEWRDNCIIIETPHCLAIIE